MITKIIQQELVEGVKSLIYNHQRFVLVGHISPDGDALGSSLGMRFLLQSLGKDATVVLHDPIASNLEWVPGVPEIVFFNEDPAQAQALIAQAEVIFCVDFNASYRMGRLQEPVLQSKAIKVMIDHHLDPESYCSITISHPKISSTCELVYRLVDQMGLRMNVDERFATAVYTGMMTDTGAFTYNSNAYETYCVVAELIKMGIDKDQIYDRVFNTCSENRERLKGYVLSEKMKIYHEYGASLFTLDQDELTRFNYKKGDSEGFVNMPLTIKGVTFSAYFRQDPEYIKVSLRSKGDFPCNLFAERYFSGGGHKNASGGEFRGTLAQAVAVFEAALPEFYSALNLKA